LKGSLQQTDKNIISNSDTEENASVIPFPDDECVYNSKEIDNTNINFIIIKNIIPLRKYITHCDKSPE
jgi:hypothetical protein